MKHIISRVKELQWFSHRQKGPAGRNASGEAPAGRSPEGRHVGGSARQEEDLKCCRVWKMDVSEMDKKIVEGICVL